MDDERREPAGRRRRRGARRAQGAPPPADAAPPAPRQPPAAAPSASPTQTPSPSPSSGSTAAAKSRRRKGQPDSGERGLRDIVGAGRSQLGVSGALRARDLNRPTDDDLAAAERDVVVVRRNWTPDERG